MLGVAIGLVGRLKNSVSPYAVLGYSPGLVLDFTNEYYRTGGALTTFDSALTATRAGNATMVDSDGKIKWAPHNLLTYSEDFSNAAWGLQNIAATTAIAPDGKETAYDISLTSTTNTYHLIVQGVTGAAGVYTFAAFFKANEENYAFLAIKGNNAAQRYVAAFNLTGSGSVSATLTTGSPTGTNATVSSLGGGWYYCAVSISHTSGSVDIAFGPNNNGTLSDINGSYAGVIGNGIYAWGAHLYRSDLGGMADVPSDARAIPSATKYVPTTSAARYLPRRGHHVYNGSEWVNEGLLVESEARTNLLTYSEQFDNAAWVKVNTTVSANTTTSPSGLTTACTITETASPNDHYINCTGITAAANWTLSVYVKKKSPGRYIQLRPLGIGVGIAYATFDPDDGSIYESGGTSLVSAVASAVGNGWHRVSITCSYALSAKGAALVVTDGTSGENPSYTGDGTSGIYIYGAQLEAGSTPSSYIPTAGATVTRAAETLVIPSANLPWPSPQYVTGTELVTNGTFDTDTDWTKGTGWTISGGVATAAGGTSDTFYLEQNIGLVAGKVYQYEFTTSGPLGGTNYFAVRFGGASDNFNVTQAKSYSGVVVASGSGNLRIRSEASTSDITIDSISVKEINPLSVSIAMDGRMTYADTGTGTGAQDTSGGNAIPYAWAANPSSTYLVCKVGTDNGTGQVRFAQETSGVYDYVLSGGSVYSPGVNVPFNIASRHGSTFINGAVDGVALTADLTPVALPDLSATNLQLGYTFMGTIGSFRIWADDIGDAGLVTATNPSTEPSLLLTFDSAETSFVDLGWSE